MDKQQAELVGQAIIPCYQLVGKFGQVIDSIMNN